MTDGGVRWTVPKLAGLSLAKAKTTPATLRESVERVLADDRFGTQAAVVRESFRLTAQVDQAAVLLAPR